MKNAICALMAVMMMGLFAAPALADCTGNETLKAKCGLDDETATLKAKMKHGAADTTVVFTVTDADGNIVHEEEATVNRKGKAKIKVAGLAGGTYTVSVCDASAEVTCE